MKDWTMATLVSIIAVFAPIKDLVLVTIILIFVDLVTGLLAARKRGEWTKLKEIKSAGIRRTFSKSLVYMTGILVGYLIEHFMLKGFIPVSNIAAGLISIIEGKSIYENLDTVSAKPIFKTLIQKLGSINDLPKEQIKSKEKKDGESL